MKDPIVFVIEDDEDILELIQFNLKLAGYKVYGFKDGAEGLRALENATPHLAIIDQMLPSLSGEQICRAARANKKLQDLPIIFVTAKSEEQDVIKGLNIGADDYITKPFSPKVLLARIEALLRRSIPGADAVEDQGEILKSGDLKVHLGRHEVLLGADAIDLTNTEFQILSTLIKKPGWVFSRSQIVNAIHGGDYAVTDRTIDFQMVGLRKKLGTYGQNIETVRGVGYRYKD